MIKGSVKKESRAATMAFSPVDAVEDKEDEEEEDGDERRRMRVRMMIMSPKRDSCFSLALRHATLSSVFLSVSVFVSVSVSVFLFWRPKTLISIIFCSCFANPASPFPPFALSRYVILPPLLCYLENIGSPRNSYSVDPVAIQEPLVS